jgi:hypothetical protein
VTVGFPAAPEARARTVSFVDVSPSTVIYKMMHFFLNYSDIYYQSSIGSPYNHINYVPDCV